jgi:hypothetical protein
VEDGLQQLKKMLELTLVVVRARIREAWKLWSRKDVATRIPCSDGAGRLKHSSVLWTKWRAGLEKCTAPNTLDTVATTF